MSKSLCCHTSKNYLSSFLKCSNLFWFQDEKKRLEKIKNKAEAEAKQAALDAAKKIPASEMFKSETDKYSKFDDKVII